MIQAFSLHLMLLGIPTPSTPRLCFCCSSWNNAALVPVVLILPPTSNRNRAPVWQHCCQHMLWCSIWRN